MLDAALNATVLIVMSLTLYLIPQLSRQITQDLSSWKKSEAKAFDFFHSKLTNWCKALIKSPGKLPLPYLLFFGNPF